MKREIEPTSVRICWRLDPWQQNAQAQRQLARKFGWAKLTLPRESLHFHILHIYRNQFPSNEHNKHNDAWLGAPIMQMNYRTISERVAELCSETVKVQTGMAVLDIPYLYFVFLCFVCSLKVLFS